MAENSGRGREATEVKTLGSFGWGKTLATELFRSGEKRRANGEERALLRCTRNYLILNTLLIQPAADALQALMSGLVE